MTDERLELEKASQMLSDLCHGRRRWEMRVPVDPDDPDVVIGEALRYARKVESSHAELLEVCEELVELTPEDHISMAKAEQLFLHLDILCDKARQAIKNAEEK